MPTARSLPLPSLRHRPARLLSRLAAILRLGRERRRLATLDDHILRDIGLTRDEALREAERPAWDVPPHWRG